MSKNCDYLIDRRDVTHKDNVCLQCLRGEGHEGPHMVQTHEGRYVVWKKDLCQPGTCSDCDSDDPSDDCLVYWEVTSAIELQKYLDEPLYEGD